MTHRYVCSFARVYRKRKTHQVRIHIGQRGSFRVESEQLCFIESLHPGLQPGNIGHALVIAFFRKLRFRRTTQFVQPALELKPLKVFT